MAIDATDAAKMRIGAVGVSVDTTLDPATLATNWTSTGGQANRNTLNTAERIITRAINALDGDIANAKISTDAFAARFDAVVGNETGADQTEFNALGGNLIQAVHGLVTAPSAMPEPTADDKLYGRKRAVGATTGIWEEIVAGGGDATSIQGRDVAITAPTDGQALAWNQTVDAWTPTTIAGGGDATSIQGRNVTSSAPTDGQALAWSQSANQWLPTTIAGGAPTGDVTLNSLQVTGQHSGDWWGLNVHTGAVISGDLSVVGGGAFCGSQFNAYRYHGGMYLSIDAQEFHIQEREMYLSGGRVGITSDLHISGGNQKTYISGGSLLIWGGSVNISHNARLSIGAETSISGNMYMSGYETHISSYYTYLTGNSVGISPSRLAISGGETYISGGDLKITSQTYISGNDLGITSRTFISGGNGLHITAPMNVSGYYNPGMYLYPGSWSMGGPPQYYYNYGQFSVCGSMFNVSNSRYNRTIYMSGDEIYISGHQTKITNNLNISAETGISGNLYVSGYSTYFSGQYVYMYGGSVSMYPGRLSISGGETYISGGDLKITSTTYISGGDLHITAHTSISGHPGMYFYSGSWRNSGPPNYSYNYGEFKLCNEIFNVYYYGWGGQNYSGMYLSGRNVDICPWDRTQISGNALRIQCETTISGGYHLGIRTPTYISGGYGFWCYDDAVFAGNATFAGSRVCIWQTYNGPGGARMTLAGGYDMPVLEVSSAYATAIKAYAWRETALSVNGEQGTAIYVADGAVYKPGGGSWATTSDARTKTDVKKYETGLKELVQLDPISFRYNGRGRIRETGKRFVGLAAEEAEGVMPEIVHTVKGKLEYDDEEETDIRMIDPSNLPYATINAFKEISQTLKRIDQRLTTLEKKSKKK